MCGHCLGFTFVCLTVNRSTGSLHQLLYVTSRAWISSTPSCLPTSVAGAVTGRGRRPPTCRMCLRFLSLEQEVCPPSLSAAETKATTHIESCSSEMNRGARRRSHDTKQTRDVLVEHWDQRGSEPRSPSEAPSHSGSDCKRMETNRPCALTFDLCLLRRSGT